MSARHPRTPRHHVVIIGCGFGGLFAAKALRRAPVRVTADRSHEPSPVPTPALSGDHGDPLGRPDRARRSAMYCATIRRCASSWARWTPSIRRRARSRPPSSAARQATISYDSLIVAGGAVTSYYGHDDSARPRAA